MCVCGGTSCSAERREKGCPLLMRILMRTGRPRPRLMSNTLEPMALETAMSPNPSRATRMELRASCVGGVRCSKPHPHPTHPQECTSASIKALCSTYGYACSHGNDNQSHDELIHAQDAAYLGHHSDEDEAEHSNPQHGHAEGGRDHIPLAIVGAVRYGPGEEDEVREGLDEEVPLDDKLEHATSLPDHGGVGGSGHNWREARNKVDLTLLLLLLLSVSLPFHCTGHSSHRGDGVQGIPLMDGLNVDVLNMRVVDC